MIRYECDKCGLTIKETGGFSESAEWSGMPAEWRTVAIPGTSKLAHLCPHCYAYYTEYMEVVDKERQTRLSRWFTS